MGAFLSKMYVSVAVYSIKNYLFSFKCHETKVTYFQKLKVYVWLRSIMKIYSNGCYILDWSVGGQNN